MNKRIKTHFQYGWWVYVLIIVAAVTLWISVFVELAKPKPYEVLNITVVGKADGDKIEEQLKSYFGDELKEINVEVIAGNNLMLGEIVAMRCLGETDFIIFEEEYIVKPASLNFSPLDENKLIAYFGERELYREEDKIYGVKMNGNFWALVTPVSENCAKINGKGEEKNDAALRAIKYLTEAA